MPLEAKFEARIDEKAIPDRPMFFGLYNGVIQVGRRVASHVETITAITVPEVPDAFNRVALELKYANDLSKIVKDLRR